MQIRLYMHTNYIHAYSSHTSALSITTRLKTRRIGITLCTLHVSSDYKKLKQLKNGLNRMSNNILTNSTRTYSIDTLPSPNHGSGINNVSFNQDGQCFSVALENGYRIFKTCPFEEVAKRGKFSTTCVNISRVS